MKKKEPMIKTKRMIFQPLTDVEIEKLIETSDSEEMKNAYGEMLDGCKADPENRIWYAPWKISTLSGFIQAILSLSLPPLRCRVKNITCFAARRLLSFPNWASKVVAMFSLR